MEPQSGRMSEDRKAKVFAFIEDNIAGNLSIWALANVAAMSRHHFCRSFRASVGTTPMGYVRLRRVMAAMSMLEGSDATISSIALDVGFSSQSHFTTAFRSVSGTTPKAWRMKFQQAPVHDQCPTGCPFRENRS